MKTSTTSAGYLALRDVARAVGLELWLDLDCGIFKIRPHGTRLRPTECSSLDEARAWIAGTLRTQPPTLS